MSNKISPHDKLFKVTMSKPQAAKEFMQRYLPAYIVDKVDLNTLRLQKDTFIDSHLAGHLTDLLYSVSFGERQGYIYVLFEHLSNPDEMVAFRLLKYMINIMEHHAGQTKSKVLPVIYPLVLYTGNRKYNYTTDIFDLFAENKNLAKEILFNPYHFMNIKDLPVEDLHNQIWFGLMAKVFIHDLKESLAFVKMLMPNLTIIDQKNDLEYLNTVIKYVIETKEIKDREKFFDVLIDNLSEKTGGNMMTIAESLRQEGRQEGWQKGRQEAIEKIAEALNLLEQRVPIDKIAELTGLSIEEIRKLSKH